MALLVPVSLGELIDKITILEIKAVKITNLEALRNVEKELEALRNVQHPTVSEYLVNELKQVNMDLWDVEDELRLVEKEKVFDHTFVGMARSVYLYNDKRAAIKRTINTLYNSEIKEEKSYATY
jgi:hypothetical protein